MKSTIKNKFFYFTIIFWYWNQGKYKRKCSRIFFLQRFFLSNLVGKYTRLIQDLDPNTWILPSTRKERVHRKPFLIPKNQEGMITLGRRKPKPASAFSCIFKIRKEKHFVRRAARNFSGQRRFCGIRAF